MRASIGVLTLLRPLVQTATAFKVDLLAVAAAAGLSVDHLDLSKGSATPGQVMDVLNLATARAIQQGNPAHFPVALGQSYSFDYLGHFATFLATSPTLRDTAEMVQRLIAMLCPIAQLMRTETATELRFALSFQPAVANAQRAAAMTEAGFASAVHKIAAMSTGRVRVLRVTFAHRVHARAQACQRSFGCPVEFDRPQSMLVFSKADFDLPLSGHMPALYQQARLEVSRLLERTQRGQADQGSPHLDDGRGHWLTRRIHQMYDAQPGLLAQGGLNELAVALDMPPRTLQRRLKDLGTTHRQLVADVRARKAKALLAKATLSVDDVARQLGFSDGRSFAASFKRWTGCTPREWAQR